MKQPLREMFLEDTAQSKHDSDRQSMHVSSEMSGATLAPALLTYPSFSHSSVLPSVVSHPHDGPPAVVVPSTGSPALTDASGRSAGKGRWETARAAGLPSSGASGVACASTAAALVPCFHGRIPHPRQRPGRCRRGICTALGDGINARLRVPGSAGSSTVARGKKMAAHCWTVLQDEIMRLQEVRWGLRVTAHRWGWHVSETVKTK